MIFVPSKEEAEKILLEPLSRLRKGGKNDCSGVLCVENNWEDLEMVGVNSAFDIRTLFPISKGHIRIIERKLWVDNPNQKCILIDD